MSNEKKKVLVVGDAMIDAWQVVDPIKISQEAPVIVGLDKGTTYSPGGAANAAVNCAHLGADTTFYYAGARNREGRALDQILEEMGVATIRNMDLRSEMTVKQRIVDTQGRHLLRIDHEENLGAWEDNLTGPVEQNMAFASLLISDYGKGFINKSTMKIVELAREWDENAFIVVNGKPKNIELYGYVDVLVMNKSEALELYPGLHGDKSAHELVANLVTDGRTRIKYAVVTDGANGLCWGSYATGVIRVHAPKVEVADTAGAGDSICASIAVKGRIDQDVLEYAVRNAASVVSQRGTSVPIIHQ